MDFRINRKCKYIKTKKNFYEKKLKAKEIIEEIEKQLKKGDVVLSHCNIKTTIAGTRNYSFVFYQKNSEINYDYCDFIVTFNRFFDYKKCCVKMLQDFFA